MKIDYHFIDYINEVENFNLHTELIHIYDNFPKKIKNLSNIIFYGPSGVGKYSQMLYFIKNYSDNNLKYEKKLYIKTEKQDLFLKISDIHYEIDMSLLGCNAKLLWNEMYNNIIDSIIIKKHKSGFIVCKNFHYIANDDLMDIFYNYMQTIFNSNINIKFIFITENISFISNKIINTSKIIKVKRPSKKLYNNIKYNNIKLQNINNIIDVKLNQKSININKICNDIIFCILNFNNDYYKKEKINKFNELRNKLYNILIYNLDIFECIWYIISKLILDNYINKNDINDIMNKTLVFFKYYNNNYRPIYHLESISLYLISKIYEYEESV